MRRIAAGVAATDYNNVVVTLFHVKHPLLAQTERREDLIEDMLHIDPPDQGIKGDDGATKMLGDDLCPDFDLQSLDCPSQIICR